MSELLSMEATNRQVVGDFPPYPPGPYSPGFSSEGLTVSRS